MKRWLAALSLMALGPTASMACSDPIVWRIWIPMKDRPDLVSTKWVFDTARECRAELDEMERIAVRDFHQDPFNNAASLSRCRPEKVS